MAAIYLIKQAEPADCPLIRQLASQIWEPTYGEILSTEQLNYMFEWMYSVNSLEKQMQSGHSFYIAYETEVPVGYLSIEQETESRYHLQKIYILPSQQGKGLGKFLIQQAERLIREKKSVDEVYLVLNVNRKNKAFHFYQKLGFQIESQGDFDIGNGYFMNDYIMKKKLEMKSEK